MPSVDERIVRMEFDNASFEKKIGNTIASLGQLDKALKLTGATQGLSDINTAANKVDFHTISDGIENVSKKFLILSTIAITALSDITSHAIQAGTQLAKSFVTQPIIDGFKEFELNMNSIQTILANTASKGTTLDQVTAALDKLNTYSDQTIYNFGQMAKNIGTFTAAGVDLQTSVDSIKGIANLAAMSGSSADQASMAMYQLSQAIATGTLHLIDWNSVVNAGMGGEAFQSALFETGKAMHTLTDVPMAMTFAQWKDAGNSFRDSLQDGWITADVLTTTLQGFTGDMTEEMLLQKGFSEQQAINIMKTAQVAKAAATEVKTFTQLVGTVQEAIGTGWADSFRIIIGNFNEAKTLWTNVNNAIGTFVQNNANARNAILQGWKDFGGRTALIETLKDAFHNLGLVLNTVKDAFHEIFPPVTAATLIRLTAAFRDFIESLTPTADALAKIKAIAQGFFAALSIGWTILKEGVKFIVNIGKALLGIVGSDAVNVFVKIADGITSLQQKLVAGGAIAQFFDKLTEAIKKPIAFLQALRDAIADVFKHFDKGLPDAVGESFGRLGDRFQALKDGFSKLGDIWKPFGDALQKVMDILDKAFDAIKNWFKELGQKIAAAMNKGDFDAVLDALNTTLLGGITLLIAKWLKQGISLDVGSGFLDRIGQSFDQLTGVLKAMQANIKAEALLKIAAAIGILTISVVALSLIDSAALTKALTAMAVGFGQLMASFTALTKIVSGPKEAASFSLISAGLILLATSMVVLSLALKILSTMSWEEIGRGLTALTGLLTLLVIATKPLAANSKGMITAGIGITALAGAMIVLGIAMKIFATMKWEDIGKGLVAVAGALLIIALATNLMPPGPSLALQGAGLVGIAVGISILAGAVALFAKLSWEEIGKGMAAIAGGLLIIALAMNFMPVTTPIIAAGLILMGIALGEIAGVMKLLATMSWAEIARGLVAMGGALLILAAALFAMEGSLPGAAALGVAALGLVVLAKAVKSFADLSWGELLKGLAGLAISLTVIALAAFLIEPVIPAILGLGVALLVLGASFALVGIGAFLIAKALKAIAESGAAAAEQVPKIIEGIAKALPALLKGLAKGILETIQVFLDAAPVMAKAIGVLINHILDTLIEMMPRLLIIMTEIIDGLIGIIHDKGPELIDLGFFIFMKLLEGIRKNIDNIVSVAGDIIVKFLKALQDEIPRVAHELANTIIAWYTKAAEEVGRVAGTLLFGVGISFMKGLFEGITSDQSLGPIIQFFGNLASSVLGWIGDTLSTLWQKGVDFLTGLWNGLQNFIGNIIGFFQNLPGNILNWVGDTLGTLFDKGVDLIRGLKNGIDSIWGEITGFFSNIWNGIKDLIPDPINLLVSVGNDIIQGLWNGMKAIWDRVKQWLQDIPEKIPGWIMEVLGIHSPSLVMMEIGENTMLGFQVGMQNVWDQTKPMMETFGNEAIDAMSSIVGGVAASLGDSAEFNPTITPVLDLTQVAADASKISDYIQSSDNLTPMFSVNQARAIARDQSTQQDASTTQTSPSTGLSFEQNIYAPTQLSTSDIYKQTRNQIRIAKEELSIP